MTDNDKDLIEALRLQGWNEAADRIEELENSLAWYQMMDAMSSDHVVELTDNLEAAEAKLTECEARLSKALDELQLASAELLVIGVMGLHPTALTAANKARAVLAELEGKE